MAACAVARSSKFSYSLDVPACSRARLAAGPTRSQLPGGRPPGVPAVVTSDGLFDRVFHYPDPDAGRRLAGLVGIDGIRADRIREAKTLLDPTVLERWSTKHYKTVLPVVEEVGARTPLVVLAGDVGTGKTELAESFADTVARDLGIEMTLYPLSLSARGRGAVGEMTTLLTAAFEVVTEAAKGGRVKGSVKSGVVLLVDEADALAQSRDLVQMHHEDRAGVNALIRGIDTLRARRLPLLTVMCTNRAGALDPAVLRRAARIFRFARPERRSAPGTPRTSAGWNGDQRQRAERPGPPNRAAQRSCVRMDVLGYPSALHRSGGAGLPRPGVAAW